MANIIANGGNIPPVDYVSLPRLAQGAVIPPNREFLAVLGDQKSGTNIETPLSTMVHVWQLKTREDFDKADYDTLFMQEEKTLEKDVLAKHTVWVKPEGTASLNVPLDKETQFVAIIGQFYHPDEKSDSWRLVIKRDELEADKPRSIELMRSDLRLLPLKDK